jgi:hypothetical protein
LFAVVWKESRNRPDLYKQLATSGAPTLRHEHSVTPNANNRRLKDAANPGHVLFEVSAVGAIVDIEDINDHVMVSYCNSGTQSVEQIKVVP